MLPKLLYISLTFSNTFLRPQFFSKSDLLFYNKWQLYIWELLLCSKFRHRPMDSLYLYLLHKLPKTD
jgi:hypothetical protein